MKSYEEMTRSVLDRAQLQRQRNKRRNVIGWTAVAAMCCLCLSLMAVFTPRGTESKTPTQQLAVQPQARIMLLSSPEDTQPKELVRDVVEPYVYQIRVHEVDDLSGDEQSAFIQQEKAYAQQFLPAGDINRGFSCKAGKESVVTQLFAGRLMLVVDDYSTIKDYTVTTAGTGHISGIGHRYAGSVQGLSFGWTLTDASVNAIMEDPQVKLSTFSDTVTICVEFTDGTTETVIADVMIQDDGQVFIIHRGVTVSA